MMQSSNKSYTIIIRSKSNKLKVKGCFCCWEEECKNNHVLRRELTLRLLLLHVHKLFLDSGISGSKCDMRYINIQ